MICAFCGKAFERTAPTRKYCSTACNSAAWRRRTGMRPRVTLANCAECGQPLAETGGRLYCSTLCNQRAFWKKHHDERLWHKYSLGVTQEDYNVMYAEQDGLCAICQQPFGKLAIDHDHATKVVRGLLCVGCNSRLGWLENRLDLILDYIKRGKQ